MKYRNKDLPKKSLANKKKGEIQKIIGYSHCEEQINDLKVILAASTCWNASLWRRSYFLLLSASFSFRFFSLSNSLFLRRRRRRRNKCSSHLFHSCDFCEWLLKLNERSSRMKVIKWEGTRIPTQYLTLLSLRSNRRIFSPSTPSHKDKSEFQIK